MSRSLVFLALVSLFWAPLSAQVAQVRHAPTLNGAVQGSIQQMTAESTTFSGGASVTGDLFVPGTPAVRLNGHPTYGGTLDGTGAPTPTTHKVTLNGNAKLGHVVRRTDAVTLPVVAAPPPPTGTRTVKLRLPGDPVGDFSTLLNLTLKKNVGQIAVPPGSYGRFTAQSGEEDNEAEDDDEAPGPSCNSGFTLGVAGATEPAIYHFQRLTLKRRSQLQVVGPVIVTLKDYLSANGSVGSAAHPEWLILRLSGDGLTLKGGAMAYLQLVAPSGQLTLNGKAQLVGGLIADRLTINGNGLLRLINLPPAVAFTSPANNALYVAPTSVTLQAAASDPDGSVAKVEFFNDATKLGTVTSAPYQFSWTGVGSGAYTLTAVATDGAGAVTVSAPVSILVDAAPTVSVTSPGAGAVFSAPASITLGAAAADADGPVAKVEFFAGSAKLGEAVTAPYQWQWTGVVAGNYSLTATATDNLGVTANSASVGIIVAAPPSVTLAGPAGGGTLASPASVSLNAVATASHGAIARVEFYRDATLVGTRTSPSVAGTSNYTLTDSALAPGIYTYTVRTYDHLGAFADSAPVTVTVLAGLPYLADFESAEGYSLGSLDGQLGWVVAQGAAVVTGADFYSGARSVSLPPATPSALIAQTFAPAAGESVVFADFYTKPVADATIAAATSIEVGAARFAFLLDRGGRGVLQTFNGDGRGGGQWTPTQFSMPLGQNNQAQNILRLTARLDLTRKIWDLYANGAMVAADLGFRENTSTYLDLFALQGHAVGTTFLDDFLAAADNPLFADINRNGIDDAWETAHGLSLTNYNRDSSPSGNGITVLQAYLQGTDPNDFYSLWVQYPGACSGLDGWEDEGWRAGISISRIMSLC